MDQPTRHVVLALAVAAAVVAAAFCLSLACAESTTDPCVHDKGVFAQGAGLIGVSLAAAMGVVILVGTGVPGANGRRAFVPRTFAPAIAPLRI